MQISVGCVDGKTYSSKVVPNEVLQAELDACGGRIGKGDLEGVRANTPEEFAEVFTDMLNDTKMQTLTFEMESGSRTFRVQNIVWLQVNLNAE